MAINLWYPSLLKNCIFFWELWNLCSVGLVSLRDIFSWNLEQSNSMEGRISWTYFFIWWNIIGVVWNLLRIQCLVLMKQPPMSPTLLRWSQAFFCCPVLLCMLIVCISSGGKEGHIIAAETPIKLHFCPELSKLNFSSSSRNWEYYFCH